jgi:hypothetical protein
MNWELAASVAVKGPKCMSETQGVDAKSGYPTKVR